MSYGLYVYHYTYRLWFSDSFRPMLSRYMAAPWDYLATASCALALTIGLGMFSYRFIELPALRLHRYLKYGPDLYAKPIQENAAVLSLTTNCFTETGASEGSALRAAWTSSSRDTRVECGAVFTTSGLSSTSFAIERIALINRSSSSRDSLSVGSIISAPCTISGKLTV